MAGAAGKILHFYQDGSPLAEAFRETWEAKIARLDDRLAMTPDVARQFARDCWDGLVLRARRELGGEPGAGFNGSWLTPTRLDLSLEGLSRGIFQLDHALREALWKLGLSAPDWQALVDWQALFFEQAMDDLLGWGRVSHSQQHQLREEVSFFRRLARVLETPGEARDVLSLVVKETARVLNCEFSAVLLPSEVERGVLRIAAVEAPPLMAQATRGMTFPLAGNGIVAQVFLSGAPASSSQPLVDLDITLRRRQTLEGLGFSDMLAYPLSLNGGVVGVLCLASRVDERPWQAFEDDWLAAIATQLALAIKALQQREQLQDRQAEAQRWVLTMLALAEPLLREHSEKVGRLARQIGARLGLLGQQLLDLEQVGCLHGVGQVFLPDALRRRPAPLWPEELELLQQHPVLGAALVDTLQVLQHLVPGIRHHHENWDGTGYPDGLAGQDIPLAARIVAVANAYVSLTSPNMHQAQRSREEAQQVLWREAGKKFDPLVVQALFSDDLWLIPGDGVNNGEESGLWSEPLPPDLPSLGSRLIATIHQVSGLPAGKNFPPAFWSVLPTLCPFDAALLWHRNAAGVLCVAEAFGLSMPNDEVQAGPDSLEVYAATCRVPAGTVDLLGDARFSAAAFLLHQGLHAAVAFPLIIRERVWGVLTLCRRSQAPFSSQDLLLGELAATVGAQALLQREMHGEWANEGE
jgi:GAF domain-containing protein